MLELTHLSKSFGSVNVVRDFALSVGAGECVVLIGPSGCGKSTLMRMILGLVQPDSGRILFDRELVTASSQISVRRRIGYVVQSGGLFPHLTVEQNIGLVARHLGWKAVRIRQRAAELLHLVRLSPDLMARYPSELSGGQQQRIGLMRALMLDPPLLLLDEPLGALDPIVRSELQADLRAIFRQLNKAVLLVTHDLYEAAFFADRIALLNTGRLVQVGTMGELMQTPIEPFVTRFVDAQRRSFEPETL